MSTHRSKPVNIRSREVMSAVNRAQHRRQLLIFLIQLFFALNLALVYRAATQSSFGELVRGPGAALFGAYAAFSVWCLHRSATRRLRWFDSVISIVLDYALYLLVMLERLGAEVAGGIELEGAPLFTYVYLFIAMRSLHYRPSYVYLAGALAALAWLGLILTGGAGLDGLIAAVRGRTFDAALLSGAVDKLLSIVAVTGVLAVSVREARKHLYASAIRAEAGRGLARLVGEDVAKEVLGSRQDLVPGKGRQQTVAILMMDIKDFTKLAANAAPSDVIKLLARYQQLVEPVIVRHGGCIDKFMGDGILAHFGALEPSRVYAAQALSCVENLLHETDKWNQKRVAANVPTLEFRVSCAVGEVVVGLVGGATKVEFTIIGDPVNVAAKLEKHAKRLGARAVTTAQTYQVARLQGFEPRYGTRAVPASAVQGIEGPLDLVVLGEKAAHRSGHGTGSAKRPLPA